MKRITSFILCIALLLSGFCFAEAAAEFAVTNGIVDSYNGVGGDVTVPACTVINSSLFYGNDNITGVSFEEGAQVLCQSALYYNGELTRAALPQSLRIIEDYNFYCLEKLESVVIPAGVVYIGSYCFYSCDNLKSITFECPVPAFGESVCAYNADDCVVYVPDELVDEYAAALPESNVQAGGFSCKDAGFVPEAESNFGFDAQTGTITAYIGASAFVDLPDTIAGVTVTAIGEGAFKGNTSVYAVRLPETVTDIGNEAFRGMNKLSSLMLPDSIVTIGDYAFYGSGVGSGLTWPRSLTSIGEEAFCFSSVYGDQVFPDSLAVIVAKAFLHANVSSVYFGTGISSIGSEAFPNASYVFIPKAEMPEILPDSFSDDKLQDVDILYNATRAEYDAACAYFAELGYTNCSVWRANPHDVGLGVYASGYTIDSETGLCTYVDSDEPVLTVYTSYDGISVNGLGAGVFRDCRTITGFYPHHLGTFTTIADEAFMNSSVRYVEMFDSITTIGTRAFMNSDIESIVIPEGVTYVGEQAFAGCAKLKEVYIYCDESVIPENAFEGCDVDYWDVNGVITKKPTMAEILPVFVDNAATVMSGCLGTLWRFAGTAAEIGSYALKTTVGFTADAAVRFALGIATLPNDTVPEAEPEATSEPVLPEATPEPAEPETVTVALQTGVKYTAVSADYPAAGNTLDAAGLGGEYSLFFAEDTVDFVMAGASVPGLNYTVDGNVITIDYYGLGLTVESADGALLMNYFDTMTIRFEVVQEESHALAEDMSIEYETKYSALYADVSSVQLDASALGAEYSVVFHADGTADVVIVGVQAAGLPYTLTDSGATVEYYGTQLSITFDAEGHLVLDYFGSMNIVMGA